MRSRRLALLAVPTALALAACGSGAGLIPQSNANTMRSDLQNIDLAFSTQNCNLAEAYIATAQADFGNLPAGVNEKLAAQLHDGLNALAADSHRQCHNASHTGPTSSSSTTGPAGVTGVTGVTGSTSSTTTSTTTTTTSTSTTSTTSTSSSGVTGVTGTTCTPVTGGNGGTPVCSGATGAGGIGGAGNAIGGAGNGAASVGN